jgi:hypothetical protein
MIYATKLDARARICGQHPVHLIIISVQHAAGKSVAAGHAFPLPSLLLECNNLRPICTVKWARDHRG